MKNTFKQFFGVISGSTDDSENEESRLAGLLGAVLLSGGINFLGSLILSQNIVRYASIFVACLLLVLSTRLILRFISLRSASVCLFLVGWSLTTAVCYTGDGLKSPVFMLYAVLSFGAGVHLGKKALYLSMTATIVATIALAVLGASGLLPESNVVVTHYSLLFNLTSLLVLVWYLQLHMTSSMTRALKESQQEVSSRKEAEEKATQSQLLLKSVLDSTHDVVVAVDNHMKVVAFNKAAFERVQKFNQVSATVGMSLEEMLPPYRRQIVLEVGERVLKGEHLTLDSTAAAADGGVAFFEELYTPIVAEDGSIGGFTIFVRTMTERKRAELALATEEQRLRQIIDLVPHFIFAKDNTGKFILVNQAVAEAYGTTVNELTGKTDADFAYSGEELRHFREDDNAVINSGVMKKIPEESITDSTGKVRLLSTQKIPFTFSGSTVPSLLGVSVDITERKRVDEELSQERNLLRTLIDSLPESVCVYIKDTQSRYVINNLAHLRSLGEMHQENVTGKTSRDFFVSTQAEQYIADEMEVIRTGQPLVDKEELSYDKSLGEERWHLTTKVPLRDASGKIIGLVGMSSDITERKRAEEALRESEERFRSLYDNATVGLYRTTPEGRVLMSNPAVVRMLGYESFDQLQQRNIEQEGFEPDYERSDFRSHLEQDGVIIGLESEWRRRDGTIIFVRESATAVRDASGRILYYDGVVEDVSERKRAEIALSEERERLAVTLRSIGDGVITTDLQGNITLMNRVAELLTGWSLDEAIGKPLHEVFRIIDEHSREDRKNPVDEVLLTKGVIELANHTVLLNRNGSEIVIADSGAPIFDEESNIVGVVLVFRDTTEKQRPLENMQRADKLQSLGVLAGGLAHDFNNLLGGIFGYLELAQHHLGPNEKSRAHIEKAMTTFNRARDLTRQLLTFSKGGVPNRKTGPLAPVLRENAMFALSGSNISAEFVLDDDLWLCDFDENQIGQVIDNLVINAQQAMPLGGTIAVSAQNVHLTSDSSVPLKSGDYVRFSVADTGTGIPPNILPRIFDPFFTTKQKGSGLGLTTVYSIIEKHNGTITVDSRQDKGTTFHVYLPASENTMTVEESQSFVREQGAGRILVMDDEEAIRETTQEMLESLGYEVVCADDGREALSKYQSARSEGRTFDAVIMDLTVPGGMGGKEGIQRLREEDPKVMAFVSSGYSNDPVLARPTEYGFTDKIQKPFRLDELANLLRRHLLKERK
jgi:PAS domain S-box-containing protein